MNLPTVGNCLHLVHYPFTRDVMQVCLFQTDAGGRKGPELPMADGGLVSLLRRCHRSMFLFNMFLFLSLVLLYHHVMIIFPSFFLVHSA